MRLPFLSPPDIVLTQLRLEDADEIAALHREDFQRPWSGSEFASLIDQDTVFGFTARPVGRPKGSLAGFVLARMAAGEAEILTVAVSRRSRRAGVGRMLMDAVLRRLHAERADALFLEVDESNEAALALYRRLGFREVARRPGYYDGPDRKKSDALVMRRDLR